jgi:hypothetical protein
MSDKSYRCGCDLQRDKISYGWEIPRYVQRETCRQHGAPVGPSINELVRAGSTSTSFPKCDVVLDPDRGVSYSTHMSYDPYNSDPIKPDPWGAVRVVKPRNK